QAPGIDREDSLAELESSFNRQVRSGALVGDVIEEEPRSPSVGLSRGDSLAQLESSFHRQVLSGDVPPAIFEALQGDNGGAPPAIVPTVGLDIPQRRRSIAGVYPTAMPSPQTAAPSVPCSPGETPRSRRASLPATQGAEPVVVDNLPKRRSSLTRPGSGSVISLQSWSGSNAGGSGMLDDDDSTTLPASPELLKQTSEMELLETAGSLGVEPVELESGPKKRQSFTVSQSWMEAAAKETAKALEAKKRLEAEKAEVLLEERQKAELAEIDAEVKACLSRLADQVVHDAAIAEAREEAERTAAVAARAEVKTVLRLMVESVERQAAREAEARQAAEAKAAEAAEIAEEALRLREARLAAEVESLEKRQAEAREAADREAKGWEEKRRENSRGPRCWRCAPQRQEKRGCGVVPGGVSMLRRPCPASFVRFSGCCAATPATISTMWSGSGQRRREDTTRVVPLHAASAGRLCRQGRGSCRAWLRLHGRVCNSCLPWRRELPRVLRDPRERRSRKNPALSWLFHPVRFGLPRFSLRCLLQERHPLEGATVSFEDVDEREGRSWWQCVLCVPNVSGSSDRQEDDGGLDDYDAMAAHIKPELWSKSSSRISVSSGSMERPRKGDVCSIM
ncbi:unnamed protein product, partial [Scytosiphon promiscuus]